MRSDTVLITGASTGIGRSTALHLAAQGYTVFAGVRREADGAALVAAAPAADASRVVPVLLDVTRDEDIQRALAQVAAHSSDGLYALINNAGFNLNGAFEYTGEAKARALMDTNFVGLAALSRAALPLLRRYAERHPGATSKLVNIGSIGSYIGIPWEAYYHASKFAVLGLSEAMRYELWPQGIRVVAVCPGGIVTDFMPKTEASLAAADAALPADAPPNYRAGLAKLRAGIGMATRFGSPPEAVAKRIGKVLATSRPRLRYLVGVDARLLLGLRRVLPEAWFHALIRSQFTA
jgi:NAD(P)-dependent dehydrogenase (short-subunit alcohol dehydrogenase family)